ncbi:MAG: hypothetical protein F4149_00085 [Gammaproteobacteria bacterium]|nr:hypothetical protein [Gammaproteobacteria bacterium]MYK82891.1 hypothetical protein [Gammaproteobacteria bacterium]
MSERAPTPRTSISQALLTTVRERAPFLLSLLVLSAFFCQLQLRHLFFFTVGVATSVFFRWPALFRLPPSGVEHTYASTLAFYELTVRRTSAAGATLLGAMATLAAGVLADAPRFTNAVVLAAVVAAIWLMFVRFLAERNAHFLSVQLQLHKAKPDDRAPSLINISGFIDASFSTMIILAYALTLGVFLGDPPPVAPTIP